MSNHISVYFYGFLIENSLKIVDCFIDGYGTVNSERIKFSNNN